MFVLDTDTCIYLIKKKPIPLLKRIEAEKISSVVISSITLGELEYGVEKSQNKKQNRDALQQFLIPLDILSFDYLAAEMYGQIRAELEAKGQVIGTLDMMIGAHALAAQAVLVSNNLKEFSRIKGLKVENWAK